MILLFATVFVFSILLFFVYKKNKNIFAPTVLFTIVIGFSLCIYLLKLSGIQSDYGYEYIIYILSLIFAFNIPSFFSIKSAKSINSNVGISYEINKRKFVFITYIIFAMVLFSFLAMWSILGAPPLLSKVDRSNYFVSGFGTIYLLIDVIDYLLLFDIFTNKYLKKSAYILLFVNIVMILLMANKTQLFFLICQFFVIYNIFRKKINFKKLLIVPFIVIIIFFIFYQHIYKGMYASNKDIYFASKMRVPEQFSYITEPYLYVVYNYENMFNYISVKKNSDIINGNGYYFIQALNKDYSNENSDVLNNQWKNNLKKYWLTTGTIFKIPLMDFGIIGTYIFSLVLGIYCNYSYKKFISNKKHLFYLYFYLTNIVAISFSFFTNYFFTINYIINILFVFFVSIFVFGKEKVGNNE